MMQSIVRADILKTDYYRAPGSDLDPDLWGQLYLALELWSVMQSLMARTEGKLWEEAYDGAW